MGSIGRSIYKSNNECILECYYDHELKACGSCLRTLEAYIKATMNECILECYYAHELKACGSCIRTLEEIAEAGRKLKDNK